MMTAADRITSSRENCVYTSCYCEENVWKLCQFVKTEGTAPLEELFVVFISNDNRMLLLLIRGADLEALAPSILLCLKDLSGRLLTVLSGDALPSKMISAAPPEIPLWKQKSGHGGQPVIWDYHVVLLRVRPQSDSQVYDLDSELSFPCSLTLYGAMAFRSDRHIRPEYHRKLRVIPANSFLMNFASDRSHMRNPDGTWKMPPPPYPPILTAESQMNLDDFISMDPAVGWGTVYSLDQFLHTYTGNPSTESSSSSLP